MLNQLLNNPAPIAPTPSNPSQGSIGLQFGSQGISQMYAPIKYKKSLYTIGQKIQGTKKIFASKSDIGGLAWQIQDEANGPDTSMAPQGGSYYDGANVITVASSPTANFIEPVLGAIQFQDFNLDTNTWGPVYGTAGAPTAYSVGTCFKRPAGDILVLYVDTITMGSLVGLKAASWSATGGWSSPFSVDTGLTGGFVCNGAAASVLDADGRLHVFAIANNLPAQEMFYQLVEADNSLGTFAIVELNGSGNIGGSGISRQPAVDDTHLVIGGLNASGQPIAYVGTPLSAPVFAAPIIIDPGGASKPPSNQVHNPVFVHSPINGWYAAYLFQSGTNVELYNLRIGQAPDLGSQWTFINAFTGSNAQAFFLPEFLGASLINPGTTNEALQLSADANPLSGGGEPDYYYLGIAVVPIEIILTGIKRYAQTSSGSPVIKVTPATAVAPPVAQVISQPQAAAPCPPTPPIYNNLCWGLRNGLLDASQFTPSELQALQLRCAQLGYVGNCPPPPCMRQWMMSNQLPHIPITQNVLDALPQAAQIGDCSDSWTKGGVPQNIVQIGLGGYRR